MNPGSVRGLAERRRLHSQSDHNLSRAPTGRFRARRAELRQLRDEASAQLPHHLGLMLGGIAWVTNIVVALLTACPTAGLQTTIVTDEI